MFTTSSHCKLGQNHVFLGNGYVYFTTTDFSNEARQIYALYDDGIMYFKVTETCMQIQLIYVILQMLQHLSMNGIKVKNEL